MSTQRIYALFQNVSDAERAIGALQDRGITRDHIGVAARRPAEEEEAGRVREGFTRVSDQQGAAQGEPEVAYEARPGTLPPAAIAPTLAPTSSVDTPRNVEIVGKEGITTTTTQDAATGAAVGTGVGLVGGLLAAAAALMVPGVGPILSGGILASAFGAAVATTAAGAAVGGVVGYLRDMGMPEQAATVVADRLREGDYLVLVDADTSQYDELKQLLLKYNAAGVDIDVNTAGQQITQATGNDPVLAQQLSRPPADFVPAPDFDEDLPPAPPPLSAHAATPSETEETALRTEGARAYEGETRDNIT